MARLLDGLLGHQNIVHRLLEARSSGKLASTYAFVGPSGIGKKLLSHGLAQALLCDSTPAPCGLCGQCIRVEKLNSEGLLFIEPVSKQIRIDEAHRVHQFLSLRSLGRSRVIIIDGADCLNPQASNSLLKILEEPPSSTYFFLISSNWDDVLPTIRSRTTVVRFAPLVAGDVETLTKGAPWLVKASQGRLDLFHQLQNERNVELRGQAAQFLTTLLGGDRAIRPASSTFKALVGEKEEAPYFAQLLQELIRDVIVSKYSVSSVVHQDLFADLRTLTQLSDTTLHRLFQIAFQLEQEFAQNLDRVLSLENFCVLAHDIRQRHFSHL